MATPPTFSAGAVLTAAQMNQLGLFLVSSNSFTAISTGSPLDIEDCFSSDYNNYRIELEWIQNTTNSDLNLRLRDSGGAVSTNYGYSTGGSYYVSGVGQFAGFNNSANESQTLGYVVGCVAGFRASACWDVFGPNLARETNFIGQLAASNMSATLTRGALASHIRQNSSTVCTGLTLFPTAGTSTGSIKIYGYRN